MSQLLKDKVAFITGSASGIGHEIAIQHTTKSLLCKSKLRWP